MPENNESIRIAKFIAQCSLASRRKAEELVTMGKVKVDGQIITNVATHVNDFNKVEVFNKQIRRNKYIKAWIVNKPRGVLVTTSDPQKRQTIYDIIPKKYNNLITVGRLDYNTEGLLILTNNGEFSRKLELPSNGIVRKYRVRLYGTLTDQMITRIENGMVINNIKYQPCKLEFDGEEIKTKNFWLQMSLTEGKNREIRNIFEYFNLKVSRLIRIEYGPISLAELKPNEIVEIPQEIIYEMMKINPK